MLLEVKKVKDTRNKAMGNFILYGRHKAQITISLKRNTLLAEYMVTLLHELLHFWTTMVRKEGFKTTDKKEHQFIYAVEEAILIEMKRHFKKGK